MAPDMAAPSKWPLSRAVSRFTAEITPSLGQESLESCISLVAPSYDYVDHKVVASEEKCDPARPVRRVPKRPATVVQLLHQPKKFYVQYTSLNHRSLKRKKSLAVPGCWRCFWVETRT